MNRKKFISTLKNRFSLRLHMTLILLASKGLFVVGLHNVALRYPVAVLCAYLAF